MTRPQPIERIRVGFIGSGGMARYHMDEMLRGEMADIVAVCEPSAEAYAATVALFASHGVPAPANEPDWRRFVTTFADRLDAVVIVTPHALHFAQATACLEAGLDVLLEKPMVMDAAEATALIATRDATGRLLVVSFQGSLSPQVRTAARMLRSGELGRVLGIQATVWQDWAQTTTGRGGSSPSSAAAGSCSTPGAHMLNTVSDLAGEDFAEIAAWLEDDGTPVDIRAVMMGRLASGALVTMHACGSAIPSCDSDIRVFCSEAILRTGIWGERLEIQRHGARRLSKVRSVPPLRVWEQFMNVRDGREANPSPPEVGLRMARLWDAIRASAARDGAVVTTGAGQAGSAA